MYLRQTMWPRRPLIKSLAAAVLAFVQPVAGQSVADLVLINANIRTMDRQRPRAAALAAKDGRIIAIGSSGEMRRLAGPNTRIIDAEGRLVIPGFNDAHVHFTAIGNRFSHLDARLADTGDKLLSAIAYHARFVPKGRWILGSGLQRGAAATLAQRDAAAGGHPLLIYLADPSTAAANSAAMKLAGVVQADGLVTGQDLQRIRRSVPPDFEKRWHEIIETASNYAASLGVTSVQDVHSDDLVDVYREVARNGRLKTRIYECFGLADRRKLIDVRSKPSSDLGLARNGCVKGLATGDDGEVADLTKAIVEADAGGLQVMVHAIGESSNANALDAFERAAKINGVRDRRFRIEHAHRPERSDLDRFARSRTIASMQPRLFYSGGSTTDDDFRAMLAAGVRLAFGSDSPMIEFNPLTGIHAAVNAGRNSISVEAAVRAYTLGSAFAEFQEGVKGTLERGKATDFVVLSNDIFTMDRRSIREVQVMTTVMDGKIVYEHGDDGQSGQSQGRSRIAIMRQAE